MEVFRQGDFLKFTDDNGEKFLRMADIMEVRIRGPVEGEVWFAGCVVKMRCGDEHIFDGVLASTVMSNLV